VKQSVKVSLDQSRKLGKHLRSLQLKIEDFLNPQLFPPRTAEVEDVLRFFFFTTGIDHRTSPPGQSFEGIVDGEYFQGADLLWHLSVRRFYQEPQIFHPNRMAKITAQQVREWFTITQPKQVIIRNPAERAALLRDGGTRLMKQYQGSVMNLLRKANHRISPKSPGKTGLLPLLSEFQAYEDPVSKKSYLLLKFILRRNLWSPVDVDKLRIPVDNHLTRIALRTGIVTVSPELAQVLRRQTTITLKQDVSLRHTIGDAYLNVGTSSNRSVLELDDFFWHFGRECCLRDAPTCVTGCKAHCFVSQNLLQQGCQNQCPLGTICLAYDDVEQRNLVEPKIKTWYY
jgi:hypothetical protein